MRWPDERYVRLYTRDTIDWHFLSFEAQGLMCLLLRKVDRAGILDLGKHGKEGIAAVIGHPARVTTILPALEELLADGCCIVRDNKLVIPNFLEAQEAVASDAQRKRDQRERDRALVTKRDVESQVVTKSHEMSRAVTPSLAEPNQPSRTEPKEEKSGSPAEPAAPHETSDCQTKSVKSPESPLATQATAPPAPRHAQRESGEAAAEPSKAASGTPEQLRELWNALAPEPLPRCMELNRVRTQHARARLREMDLTAYREVIQRIGASRFCRGENDRGWMASFDWLLRPDTAARVMEGKYDDRGAVRPRDPTKGPAPDADWSQPKNYPLNEDGFIDLHAMFGEK